MVDALILLPDTLLIPHSVGENSNVMSKEKQVPIKMKYHQQR
jgi:hypothetical protein